MSGEGGRRNREFHGKLWATALLFGQQIGGVRVLVLYLSIIVSSIISGANHAAAYETKYPWNTAVHRVGHMRLMLTNRGLFGHGFMGGDIHDAFTNDVLLWGFEYPPKSGRHYLWKGGVLVGAPSRLGPVVSNPMGFPYLFPGASGEFAPDPGTPVFVRRSTLGDDPDLDNRAVSEEDFICVYTDTQSLSPHDTTLYTNWNALGVKIIQSSYAWSFGYTEDFIIMNLRLENIGRQRLKDCYVGLVLLPDAAYKELTLSDNLYNYRETYSSPFGCSLSDSLSTFWWADNDGQAYHGVYPDQPVWAPEYLAYTASVRSVMGLHVLEGPGSTKPSSFNWWAVTDTALNEWVMVEPCRAGNGECSWQITEYRDRELFERMINGEWDYNMLDAPAIARRPGLSDWIPVPVNAADRLLVSNQGAFLFSWGPLWLQPGAETQITLAWVAGEHFHNDVNNVHNLPQRVDRYLNGVDFSDLHRNVQMAQWVYDNPGVDTDDDGYFGEFRVCVRDSVLIGDQWVAQKADTQWYKGDGIPDYRGALPPPAPYVWIEPVHNGLNVRFNGQVSETEKDIFLQKPDFEGYRVYLGRDERATSLSVVASYDFEDYDKYCFDKSLEEPDWKLKDEPFSKDELRCLYGLTADPCNDSTFDPLLFTLMSPYRHPMYPNDSLFWFKPHDYNASTYGISTPITKTYPDMPDPRLLSADSITEGMYTEDGYLKFYEYECTIENILPTVSYCINVTAFDYGSPAMGVAPMESDKSKGIIEAFPLHALDQPLSGSDNIYVYPNPYRIDINYREMGLEGRNQDDRWDERVRAIWFANLPPVCTIHIYTIDGDRVRTIEHNVPATDPTSRRHSWDLINRNYQKVESGLYYWVVEIPGDKTQIGKLAIIR